MSWWGFCFFPTHCILRASLHSFARNIFPGCVHERCSFMAVAIRFGSHDEMNAALALIPAQKMLLEIEGAGHELLGKKANEDLPVKITQAFQEFFAKA